MNRVKVLIIGAGISGLSIAYHLGVEGVQDVLVLDKGYFASGATGRCGAGVRQQWSTKQNCLLTKWSMDFFERAHEILDYKDLELKQEGYLLLATTIEEEQEFKKNVELQNELGIPSRFLSKEEALQIVPHLNSDSFMSASFNQSDGHLNPFKTCEAFYLSGKRLGINYQFHEEVLSIELVDNVFLVTTSKNKYVADKVVNAAGGYSYEVGQMVGLDLPIYSEKHEILATEPIEKFQGPMVMSFSKNIYIQQVPHGPFLMGRSDLNAKPSHDITSSREFVKEMSKTVMDLLPKVGELRVIRTWAGSYNMSLDRQPIIGKTPIVNFYVACGFSGHGFMLGPIVGKLMSEIILEKDTSMEVESLSLERFKNKENIVVEQFVV